MARFIHCHSRRITFVLSLAVVLFIGHFVADAFGVSPEILMREPISALCSAANQQSVADAHLGLPLLDGCAPPPRFATTLLVVLPVAALCSQFSLARVRLPLVLPLLI